MPGLGVFRRLSNRGDELGVSATTHAALGHAETLALVDHVLDQGSCVVVVDQRTDGDGDLDTCEIILNPNLDLNDNTVLDDCECLFSNYCQALPNTTGLPGQISYTGSALCSFNDFTLIATDVPNNQFGVFYYGPNQTEQVFGEGYRCVSGQTTRLSVVNTGPLGFATSPIDNTEAPHNGQIDPGSTWNFQFWYRDPSGPGGNGFNLSDAIEVSFAP